MRYLEDYDVAQRHATAAVVHMKSRAIPWNPRNFTIWYEYVAGGNDALKQMINSLGVSDDDLCHDQLASVYAKTTKSLEAAPQAHEWAEKIELVANQIVEAISDIGRDTRLYGQALEIFSGDIVGTTNLSDFNSHVAKILSETRIMDSQTHALQTRVNDASEEIETLKQSLDEARRDAVTDGLTGVAIRKGFDEALEQAVEISKEKHAPLSLIIADLDHFKLFNDTHRHQLGDRVLRVVGATLLRSVKGQDTPARFGGKEFAMVLPNTTVGGACAVAEVIRKAIATTKLVRKGTDQKIASISVSVGVTEYSLGEPTSEFVERANEALYQTKKSGRNRVVSDVRPKKPAWNRRASTRVCCLRRRGNGIMRSMLVLFTDFGDAGPYVGQMKAVLGRDAPAVQIIDLLHDAPAFEAKWSAYLLASFVGVFPTEVVFLCVVDPGVGGDRKAIVVEADGRKYVGPDNGLFELVIRRANNTRLWRIDWRPEKLSASFHGRDLFAPVAALLARGKEVPGTERPIAEARRPDWPDDLAEIVYIDSFGNAMTGLRASGIPATATLECRGHRFRRGRTFSDAAPGEAFWYENSNGLAEIAVNQGRARELLGLGMGLAVAVHTDPA